MRAASRGRGAGALMRLFAVPLLVASVLVLSPGTATAAITAAELTTGADTGQSASYTTASISPTANTLILAWITNTRNSTPGTATLTYNGTGLTFVAVTTVTWGTIAAPLKRTTLFRAMATTTPTSGTVTINLSASGTGCSWSIHQFGNVDTSGTDGSGAVVQAVSNATDSNTSLTINLAALANAGSATAGGFANAINIATSISPGGGYTAFTGQTHANPNASQRAEWRADGSTTVNVTSTSSAIAGIGVEIRHDPNFDYRRSITIKAWMTSSVSACGSSLSNFPILVSRTDNTFKTVANGGTIYNAGYDIIFRAADERTQLDHEIEKYDGGTGEIVAWVRIPTLTYNADTTFYMYYSNPAIAGATANPTGVWNTSYGWRGVWHLNEATASNRLDSTANGNTLTPSASQPTLATGQIAGGANFVSASSQKLSRTDALQTGLDITGPMTVEAWVNPASVASNMGVVSKWRGTGTIDPPYILRAAPGDATHTRPGFGMSPDSTTAMTVVQGPTTSMLASTWYHVAGVYDGTYLRVYKDGIEESGSPVAYNLGSWNSDGDFIVGARAPNATFFDGILDEVRVSATDRSACWLGVEQTSVVFNANPSYLEMSAQGAAGPTAIELVSLGATSYPSQGVLVAWQTGFEVDNLGFHVYREQGGQRARVTPGLIAGSALLAGAGTALGAGQSYEWWDEASSGAASPVYWLEEWELDGTRRWHGPVGVQPALAGDPAPRIRPLARLSALGAAEPGLLREGPVGGSDDPARSASLTVSSAGFGVQAGTVRTMDGVSRSAPRRHLEQIERQWAVAGAGGFTIGVKRPGWYRVNRDELVGLGLDPAVDPRSLQLYVDGVEIPVRVVGEEDGVFDPGDTVEWYGEGVDTAWTDTRVYYLIVGNGWGQRIEFVDGVGGGGGGPVSFPFEIVREDQTVYFAALKNGELDNFFGAVLSGEVVRQGFNVHHLDTAGEVELIVRLQGVTANAHRVRVSINGASLGQVEWEDLLSGEARFAAPAGVVRDGTAVVSLEPRGGEADVSLIDRITLRYAHTYRADGGVLPCTVPGGVGVVLAGFGAGSIRVIDVTDSHRPQELRGPFSNGSVAITVPGAGTRSVIAFDAIRVSTPAWVRLNEPSSLWAAQGADLVVIGAGELLPALAPLVQLRQSQGLGVLVADIEDVMDEFGAGEWGPAALHAFLSHAASGWDHPARYVLLVGDSTVDPRDYLGFGVPDLVPSQVVETEYSESASDAALADTDGDGLADLAIGRLPVATLAEAQAVVAKIVAYDRQTNGHTVVLVSDTNDEYNDFEGATRALLKVLPRNQTVTMMQRGFLGAEEVRSRLIEELQRGPLLVNYVGHGSVQQWAGGVLHVDYLEWLSSVRLTTVLAMTCLNGFFQDPTSDGLGEVLLKSPLGGAAAVWASTGLTEMEPQAVMDSALLEGLFATTPSPRLGDLILAATAATTDPDVRATWVLLGDPTMRVH